MDLAVLLIYIVIYTHIPQTVLALRGSYLVSIAITFAFRNFTKDTSHRQQ